MLWIRNKKDEIRNMFKLGRQLTVTIVMWCMKLSLSHS